MFLNQTWPVEHINAIKHASSVNNLCMHPVCNYVYRISPSNNCLHIVGLANLISNLAKLCHNNIIQITPFVFFPRSRSSIFHYISTDRQLNQAPRNTHRATDMAHRYREQDNGQHLSMGLHRHVISIVFDTFGRIVTNFKLCKLVLPHV